jgi:hypothetical protein
MPDVTGERTLGSILETLVPVMAQAGSAGDAAVLLLEHLVTRRSCTAAWMGRLTERGDLVGLAEVDVGISARDVHIDAAQSMHPLMRTAIRPAEPPHVAPIRELGMEQAAIVPMPILEPARFAVETSQHVWAWGVMPLTRERHRPARARRGSRRCGGGCGAGPCAPLRRLRALARRDRDHRRGEPRRNRE